MTLTGHDVIQNGCMTLTRVRELIQEVVAVRQRLGDTNLHYLNGLQFFGEADAVDLPDDLHPNPVGYARMGERFAKSVFSDSGLNLLR